MRTVLCIFRRKVLSRGHAAPLQRKNLLEHARAPRTPAPEHEPRRAIAVPPGEPVVDGHADALRRADRTERGVLDAHALAERSGFPCELRGSVFPRHAPVVRRHGGRGKMRSGARNPRPPLQTAHSPKKCAKCPRYQRVRLEPRPSKLVAGEGIEPPASRL